MDSFEIRQILKSIGFFKMAGIVFFNIKDLANV